MKASTARETAFVAPTSRNCAQRIGASVSASSSEMMTATDMVTPNWKKNLPMMPGISTTGRKIARMASDAAIAADVISRAPTSAAFTFDIPSSR